MHSKFSKADAVRRFGFVPEVYNAIDGYGFRKDMNEYDLCGVVFLGNWAFVTNNHFLGRMNVSDRASNEVVYFDLREDSENKIKYENITNGIQENTVSNNQQYLFYNMKNQEYENREIGTFDRNIKCMHKFFFDIRENFVKFNKDHVIDEFDNYFGRQKNEKIRSIVEIEQIPRTNEIKFKIKRINKEDKSKEKTFFVKSSKVYKFIEGYCSPGKCTLNCFYFYEILKTFEEFNEVVMSYDNEFNKPVVLKGVSNYSDDPEILFAIAQAEAKY